MTAATLAPSSFRFFGRSFLAFVLAPNPPLARWLEELDRWTQRSREALSGRPVVVDLSNLPASRDEVTDVLRELSRRQLRVVSVEGVDPSWVEPQLAPLAVSGRAPSALSASVDTQAGTAEPRSGGTLTIDRPVRSGETICHLDGDVTVIGSVSSGAEIIAGGSVHIYGALRGRVIAGTPEQTDARIFCRKFLAELVGIAGIYTTADGIAPELAGRAIQASLEGDALIIAPLD